MKPGGGKQKGAQYERAICQRLSLWVSKMTREDCFWRSAMSGGRATLRTRRNRKIKFPSQRKSEHVAQCGDVSATHGLGNLLLELFVVECKHVKDLSVEAVWFGKRGQLGIHWGQVKSAAETGRRYPLLIAKQNIKPEIVCTTSEGYAELRKGGPLRRLLYVPRWDMNVMLLTDLLGMVDFHKIRQNHEHPQVIKRHYRED